MDLAEAASLARIKGQADEEARLLREAFLLEREAASLSAADLTFEPTRSVLHRSAASLAIDCGEYREAERLITAALSGEPPAEIADELRDLLEQVYFHRHLSLRGLTLEPEEVQLAIAGSSIGFGIAPSDEYVERVQAFEKMVYRTAERKMGIEYRERGNPERDIRTNFGVFVSVPRAASMAVTLRVGAATREQQLRLNFEKVVGASEIIDEIVYCLEVLNMGGNEEVEKHIQDKAYFNNFVALTKKMAPDGQDVNVVGLTVIRNGKKREVPFTKTTSDLGRGRSRRRPQLRAPAFSTTNEIAEEGDSYVEVEGRLKYADSIGTEVGTIKLVDSRGDEHTVIVPEGMMSDIVRPLWDSYVAVTGVRTDSGILLDYIKKATKKFSSS
jgi:hypothetical protein